MWAWCTEEQSYGDTEKCWNEWSHHLSWLTNEPVSQKIWVFLQSGWLSPLDLLLPCWNGLRVNKQPSITFALFSILARSLWLISVLFVYLYSCLSVFVCPGSTGKRWGSRSTGSCGNEGMIIKMYCVQASVGNIKITEGDADLHRRDSETIPAQFAGRSSVTTFGQTGLSQMSMVCDDTTKIDVHVQSCMDCLC